MVYHGDHAHKSQQMLHYFKGNPRHKRAHPTASDMPKDPHNTLCTYKQLIGVRLRFIKGTKPQQGVLFFIKGNFRQSENILTVSDMPTDLHDTLLTHNKQLKVAMFTT